MANRLLIVIVGPTGVGKTSLCLEIAKWLECEIISADSRQIYRDIPIGTAAPTEEERQTIPHHFVGTLSLDDYFNAARFEKSVLAELNRQFDRQRVALMTGGSMMYIDAVCKGIDDIPVIDPELRAELQSRFELEGLDTLRLQLNILDPEYYQIVDLRNPKRVLHALEVCLMSGRTYTSFRRSEYKPRPFSIVKIGLTREREELYERINARVDKMVEDGLIEEARKVYPFRAYNSLNTLGYKELFAYFDGETTLEEAIAKIKQNSRIYSRKQMTWFKRDPDIHWFHPNDVDSIRLLIESERHKEL